MTNLHEMKEPYDDSLRNEKLLVINVAGGGHGPELYARSKIHDNVADQLTLA